jgi:hypothetical protein
MEEMEEVAVESTGEPPREQPDEDDLLPHQNYENYDDEMHRYKPQNCCERLCCGGLQGMACGWPKGTVRAIIAITLLIVVLAVESFLVVWLAIAGDHTSAIAVGAAMMAELGAVGGFYYGSRTSKGNKDDTTHHDDDLERQIRRRRGH